MFDLQAALQNKSSWLVTGGAGFIGSHLVQRLLSEGQRVTVLDNFSTGYRHNIADAIALAGPGAETRFTLVEGDIATLEDCQRAVKGADYVLHQAALGSVPRSIETPLNTHRSNVDGFLNMLVAARDAKVKRFVFASSSSVYGDHPVLPKVETQVGNVLSPYAATKHINEVYAAVFERCYGLQTIGLRYFNVFGPRQDPNGAYAAVIPRWMALLAKGETCDINGDGLTSRDFCFVANAVQANLRSALCDGPVSNTVYNVSVGGKTSLLELFDLIRDRIALKRPEVKALKPRHGPTRAGDIRDSQANISKIMNSLSYLPTHTINQGLDETVGYYLSKA